jgi:hypothetical protein
MVVMNDVEETELAIGQIVELDALTKGRRQRGKAEGRRQKAKGKGQKGMEGC